MQISDASSIARLVPSRFTPQVKQPQADTPQANPDTSVSTPTPAKTLPNATPIASPPIPDLPPSLPQALQVEHSPVDPMQALMADWGKTNSPHDLDGDGTVGIKDMLQLLKQMAEAPNREETDPLQALLNDWGKTDSPHDLNGDGTVGIQDMLQLLAGMATDPVAEPDGLHDPRPRVPDDSAGDGMSQPDRLQALLDDWGKAGSKYDLDGDGTVGMSDMLALLKKMAHAVAQPPAGDPGAQTPGQTRLQQLLENWGGASEEFDLNADGTVGIRDMLMLLAQMSRSEPETDKAAGFDPKTNDKFNHLKHYAANYHRASAHDIARALMPQIGSMEPGELRESIQGSEIPSVQKQYVLDQIAAWHPHGHQFSAVG